MTNLFHFGIIPGPPIYKKTEENADYCGDYKNNKMINMCSDQYLNSNLI